MQDSLFASNNTTLPTKNEPHWLYTDGGSRGNPGPAGCGGVVYNEEKDELATFAAFIGKETNNVAEYMGLLLGLQKAQQCGITNLIVRMDSQLIVRQMQGKWKCKHPNLRQYFEKAKNLSQNFTTITFEDIRREHNKRADALANWAMDTRSSR